MSVCACGCGTAMKAGQKWVHGHSLIKENLQRRNTMIANTAQNDQTEGAATSMTARPPQNDPAGLPREVVQPEPVFTLPNEYVDKLTQLEAAVGKMQPQTTGQPELKYVQIPVTHDTTPIAMVTNPEVLPTSAGPMIVRRRLTKTRVYGADGKASDVPAVHRAHYLNKGRGEGKPVFFEQAPAELPKNAMACPYCYKKFRPSTAVEQASNNARLPSDDPELVELLKGQGIDLSGPQGANDVEFKLAEHIRVRHGRRAAFERDPLALRAMETRQETLIR